MLFQPIVPALFKQMNMEVDEAATRARKQDVIKRLDYYHDGQHSYVVDHLNQIFSEPEKLTPCFINIVKKIVNNQAAVYSRPPVREVIEGSKRDGDTFKRIADECGLSLKMKTASRYTKLLKTVLIRPVWRRGQIDLDILTGDIVDVEIGDSPEDLQSVLITHYPESNRMEEIEFSFWTDTEFKRLNYQGYPIYEKYNPYDVLPFIPVWDRCPVDGFWQSGGDDLLSLQDAINEKLTDLLYLIRMQSFGIGWIRNPKSTGGTVTVNPGTLIELTEDGSLGFESQQPQIKQTIDSIEFLITQAAVSNGLSASSISTKVVRESGLAKVQGKTELEELRRDDIILWRRYETQVFNMIRTVWNHHRPDKKLSENAELSTDFADPKPIISEKDQAETWQYLISLGVISPVDVVLARNPELKNRDDAKKYLETVKAENSLFLSPVGQESGQDSNE